MRKREEEGEGREREETRGEGRRTDRQEKNCTNRQADRKREKIATNGFKNRLTDRSYGTRKLWETPTENERKPIQREGRGVASTQTSKIRETEKQQIYKQRPNKKKEKGKTNAR